MMIQETLEDVINITNTDNEGKGVILDGLETVPVSDELVSGLKLLAKCITEDNGENFSLNLPEGISDALSKVVLTSFGVGAPWASVIGLVSVAACKYFFGIKTQLADIDYKLTEIVEFLKTDKLCELESQFKFLEFSYDNYEYIVTNEAERLATIFQIQSTKKVALKDFMFYEKYISSHLRKTSNVKSALIDEANEFLAHAECYRYSAEMYCLSLIMELIFSQNYNAKLISNVKKEISVTIQNANKNLGEALGAMKKVLVSKNFHKDWHWHIISKIKNYEDLSERGEAYDKILEELLERVNSPTELIIKNDKLFIR